MLIPGQLAFGADTDSMFRRRTSNEVEFRMAGTDMVRINTTGLYVEAGNLEVESGNVIASGNISGSSTSTGSFGAAAIGLASPGGGSKLNIRTSSNSSYPLLIEGDIDNDGGYTGIQFGWNGSNYNKAAIHIEGTSGNVQPDLHFLLDSAGGADNVDASTDKKMSIFNDGTVEFPVANQKISGSSTSTGSFGRIVSRLT